MSVDLVKQLKKIKNHNGRINPDQVWVEKNRGRLMDQIGNTVEVEKVRFDINMFWQGLQIILPGRIAYNVIRPVSVFLLVLAIAASGWITTVGATQNSLPGDITYGVKVAVSKMTKDNIDVAKDISQDVKKVAAKKDKDVSKNVAVGVEYLKESIDSATQQIKKSANERPEDAIEGVKKMNVNIKKISQNLKDAKSDVEQSLVTTPDTENTKVEAKMDEVKKLVSDSAIAVAEQVIQKKIEGQLSISDADVKQIVTDHIDIMMINSNDVKTETDKVIHTAASSTVLYSSSTLSIDLPSSNVGLLDKAGATTTIKDIVVETTKIVTENQEAVVKNLETAKQLIDGNHLLEAIQIVKEVNQATTEVQKTVTETKKIVQEAVTSGETAVNTTPTIATSPATTTAVVNTSSGVVSK